MSRSARRVSRSPDEVRRSRPVSPEKVEAIHKLLGQVSVEHGNPDDADSDTLIAQFHEIRGGRNRVQAIYSKLSPRLGQLRADLGRIDAVIAAESAELSLPSKQALAGCKNESQRKAKLRALLREWYEARDEVRADLHLVEEVIAHAKWIREELRCAFDEASRILTSIDLAHKFER